MVGIFLKIKQLIGRISLIFKKYNSPNIKIKQVIKQEKVGGDAIAKNVAIGTKKK